MIGKVTRASVEEYVKDKGLSPVQIDGIPEGFSFRESELMIGDIVHKGRIVKFKPLADFSDKDAITYE